MMKLPDNPTTMIGSMPHEYSVDAFEPLNDHPLVIPAWPQLPKRSFKEAMIPQYSEGFPGVQVDRKEKKVWVQRDDKLMDKMAGFFEDIVSENLDAFSISDDYAEGLHSFLKDLQAADEKLPFIKGQVTGPFTFGLGLNDQDGKAVWFDPQYKEVVIKGLIMKGLWQVRELKKYADNVIIFFDEPILSALGTPAYMSIEDEEVLSCLNEMIEAVHKAGAAVGIHCCGNMDWGLLARTNVDIINFDAYFYGDKIILYPEQISAFLNRGGILAWGIVPTGTTGYEAAVFDETAESLKKIKNKLIDMFTNKGIPEKQIMDQMILTPSCGMGSISPEASNLVLKLLEEISK